MNVSKVSGTVPNAQCTVGIQCMELLWLILSCVDTMGLPCLPVLWKSFRKLNFIFYTLLTYVRLLPFPDESWRTTVFLLPHSANKPAKFKSSTTNWVLIHLMQLALKLWYHLPWQASEHNLKFLWLIREQNVLRPWNRGVTGVSQPCGHCFMLPGWEIMYLGQEMKNPNIIIVFPMHLLPQENIWMDHLAWLVY